MLYKSQGKNPQCQAVSAFHKEDMLNWWQTLKLETRVWKRPGFVCPLSHEVCPVRDCSALVEPRQEEISGVATGWRWSALASPQPGISTHCETTYGLQIDYHQRLRYIRLFCTVWSVSGDWRPLSGARAV